MQHNYNQSIDTILCSFSTQYYIINIFHHKEFAMNFTDTWQSSDVFYLLQGRAAIGAFRVSLPLGLEVFQILTQIQSVQDAECYMGPEKNYRSLQRLSWFGVNQKILSAPHFDKTNTNSPSLILETYYLSFHIHGTSTQIKKQNINFGYFFVLYTNGII